MIGPRCKICRRLAIKLFLKGERCFGQKCGIVKRNYPPGLRSKKRGKKISDYGMGLMEKQKLRNWYNLSEQQFSGYVKKILEGKRKHTEIDSRDQLIKIFESRLDNIVCRMGLAASRSAARQMVTHGHLTVNGSKVDIPSYRVKEGDEVEVRAESKNKKRFQDLKVILKGFNAPTWLSIDKDNMRAKVINLPSAEEVNLPVETSAVFEFYSK